MEKNEIEVRRMLESIVAEGAYNTGHVIFFSRLYDKGYQDARDDIKNALGIEDCSHD